MLKIIELNNCKNLHTYNKGLSNESGTHDFVHVKGNTSASHIAGSRESYSDNEIKKLRQ